MVVRVGVYYRAAFKEACGLTQGDPLSPTIFNVVVDATVRHWGVVMVEGVEERGDHGQDGRHQKALFYADDVMVASSDPQWLQGAFSNLVGLFDRVGPRRLAWVADHADCLPDISLQAHPIEQADQVTKCTLEPSWVRRCNHDIVCIE